MELQIEIDTLDPPPSPPSPSNNNKEAFVPSRDHYVEWSRMVGRSAGQLESDLEFLYKFGVYLFTTVSLGFTLSCSIYELFRGLLGSKMSDTEDGEDSWAVVFHAVTCVINYFSQKGKFQAIKPFAKTMLQNFCFMLKPFRYWELYNTRREVIRIIKDVEGKEAITEQNLQSLAKLYSKELEDKRVDMYECFLQEIPMSLLQMYFLFQTYESFQLCNVKDLARLLAIISPVFEAAESASTFEATKDELEKTIHFIAYIKSNNNHPMVLYKKVMVQLRGLLNIATHFSTISARIYTATYFMVVSPFLSLIYLFIVFVVNLVLILIFPQYLLDIHQHPPLGLNTTISFFMDRYLNIFTNVGTRFTKFTDKKLKYFRVPLVLWQFAHFLIPFMVTYIISYCFGVSSKMSSEESSVEGTDPYPENASISALKECGHLALASIYYSNEIFTKLGALPLSYASFNDELTFNDVFNFFHVIWLVFYAQLLCTFLYAYADLMTRRRGPNDYSVKTYPILIGYAFYEKLLQNIQSASVQLIRKFIVLSLMKEYEFYRAIKKFRGDSGIERDEVENITTDLIGRLGISDEEVETKINECFEEGQNHRFLTEFMEINGRLNCETNEKQRLRDRKLFLGFFATFDRKLVQMSSDRIERIFKVFGWEVERSECEWERSVEGDGEGEELCQVIF